MRRFSAVGAVDMSANILFIPATSYPEFRSSSYQGFLEGLQKAKKIRIEALFYEEGTRVFEFQVEGLDTGQI